MGTGRFSHILDSIVIGGYFFSVTPNAKVQAIQWSACVIDGRKGGRYTVVYILLQISTLLCYTIVSALVWYWVLVLLEANIIGYWVPCLISFQPY